MNKNMKRIVAVIGLVGCVLLTGCSDSDKNNNVQQQKEQRNKKNEENAKTDITEFDIDTEIDEDYLDESYDKDATKIELSKTYTITSAGTYVLSGNIEDGQIIVNNTEKGKVKLVFDGVDVSCSNGPAVNVIKGKTIITLTDGSENFLMDGTKYDDESESACIYSKDDLCINGSGSLKVSGNYKAGVQSKDDLRIINGNITVDAVGDGIKAKDSIVIKNGNINIKAGKDGIQATNTELEKGYILIAGGDINVSCNSDGIKAESIVEINSGKINVDNSEEGIEAIYVRINGGDIKLFATDDGINAGDGSGMDAGGRFAGGNMGGLFGGQAPMGDENTSSVVPKLYINGGNLYVNAAGDGLDSNGGIYINGGKVIVEGPTNSGNGFFDCATAFEVKGGEMIGSGSSGMLEVPDSNSTQLSLVIAGINGAEGDEITVKDSDGNQIMSYKSSKVFQAIVYSGEKLKEGETYTAYNNDKEIGSVKVSQSVNYIGEAGRQPGGFGGKDFDGGNRGPQDMPQGDGGMPPKGFFGGEKPQRPMEDDSDNSV